MALKYPLAQAVQKVLSAQAEQLTSQVTHFPSRRKYPLSHPKHSPSFVTELQPAILTHCPPSKYVLEKAGHEEHTKEVLTI